MKCPDCGGEMTHLAVMGLDDSFRCGGCGGVWMAGWVVNRMAQNGADSLVIDRMDKGIMVGGDGNCPTDAMSLLQPSDIPGGINCFKCGKCGWWWFSADEVFKFRDAFQARVNYFSFWKKKSELAAYALPALAVVGLFVGLIGSTVLVGQRQSAETAASVGVKWFNAVNSGVGVVETTFASSIVVSQIEYRVADGVSEWVSVVVNSETGVYKLRLDNLGVGRYEMRILGKEFDFEVLE